LIASLIVVVVLLGAAVGVVAYVGPDRLFKAQPAVTHSAAAQPVPSVSPVLGSLANGVAPTSGDVSAALRGPVAAAVLGPSVNVSVIDVLTGDSLYAMHDNHPAAPASTTKMATAASVLATRGPDYRIRTTAVAGPNTGEVVLVGAGDPTMAAGATGFYPGAARLDQLAAKVKASLGGQAPTKVVYDGSLYVGSTSAPGWDPGDALGPFGAKATALAIDGARVSPRRPSNVHSGQARVSQPDLVAAQAFAKALGLSKTAVVAGKAPANAQELGAVLSPRVEDLIEIMLEDSDNVVAEALARQVALAQGKPASFVAAGQAIHDTLAGFGVPVEGVSIVDGSGLSRQDRETPRMQTALLALAAGDTKPELRALIHGLPVAGWSGTMVDRNMNGKAPQAGAGVVRAKTGTLTGVADVSGLVVTKGGRLLAFSILADAVPPGPNETDISRDGLDVITNALAGL
jgi:serine-type D-Ala-D-Ala carboxypeptidase/endopeptidase (penicillin-binding protein 4)